jgi:Dolichyl-phosphate-mannose-protein mannosyltransferase
MRQTLPGGVAADERAAEQSRLKRDPWFLFAVALIVAIVAAAIRWSLAHPYGIHWDEAQYLNDVQIDAQRLRTGHLLKLAGRILIKNLGRPPAYRLFALPFVTVFGYHTTEARLISLACFVLSAFFIFRAVRLIAMPAAGAFAALVFALSPEVVSGSIFFSTDGPLYLATAATLYYVLRSWTGAPRRNWIGLGCAVGLGFLAKTSFILIGPPVLAFWFAAGRWGRLDVPSLMSQRRAGALALMIAGPWWILNAKSALAYGQYARDFSGNSLGRPSLATWMEWSNSVLQCLLGYGLAILIGLVLVTFIVKFARKRASLGCLQIAAIGACACAGLPIVAEQLSGTNHLLRHITPAMIPLAMTVGVLASASGWLQSSIMVSISGVLFCAQAIMLISPVVRPNQEPPDVGFVNAALPWRTMSRFDQWDWWSVLNLAESCQMKAPEISVIGGGRTLNPPQIQFPWIAQVTSTRDAKLAIPNVTWLWRHEEGPPDWSKIMDGADRSDIVITAPEYLGDIKGKEDPDNHYNAEFEERLLHDPRFQGPYRFQMGRFAPVEVAVFTKRGFSCPQVSRSEGR